MTIGQIAQNAGVGVETIRFYERQGLIAQPPRRPSGYRDYPPEAVTRILFIRRAKDLGFSLREIADLLSLRVEPGSHCDEVRHRAEAKIADIEQKISSLRRIKKTLAGLAHACEERASTSECPILDSLEPHR